MATVEILQGMGISDAILNSTGDISNWSAFLDSNFFDDWTPSLFNGQVLQVPDSANVNVGNIASLAEYPANNFSVPDIYSQIDALFASLVGLTPIPSVNVLPVLNDQTFYTVRVNETIGDVVMNSSGSIENWDLIVQNAFFSEWVPSLFAGQQIPIPSTINLNSNVYRSLNAYPANNFSVPDIYNQIDALFALLDNDPWILATSFWRDIGIWQDEKFWID